MEGQHQAGCAIHPEREALTTCSRCGTFSCQECLSQSPPGQSLCAACMAREATGRLPWDDRAELGWATAFWRSLGPILLRPGVTFSTVRPDGDMGGSLLFCLIANFLGYFTTFVLFAIIGAFVPTPQEGSETPVPMGFIMASTYGVLALVAPFFGVIGTVLMAAADHLVLRLISKPRSIETTVRAAALAQAPLALGLIPICGMYVAPIWALVAKVFAYKGFHRVTAGTAVAGALLAPVLLTVLFCGLYALLIFAVVAASGTR